LSCQPTSLWRQILRRNFTNWEKLADYLELDANQRTAIIECPRFPLNLPWRLAEKIQKKTLDDPILKQFLPTKQELDIAVRFIADPVGDSRFRLAEKLLHKYHGRALIVSTGACAMHCRFCFRQNFDYETENKNFDKELEILKNDSSIHEVILSGGDPLSLSNATLTSLLGQIATLPHVKRVRFHTRFPMGIPERIDEEFLALLHNYPLQVWMVIHANHPREFDADILASLKSLRLTGAVVLCQSVLLRGVNDSAEVLAELMELLVDNGILPYYLHQLDCVQGSQHFEVAEAEGRKLIQEISAYLPGFAVPKYVREIAGEQSKSSLL
jgi:lysine 2,3-aminomutase